MATSRSCEVQLSQYLACNLYANQAAEHVASTLLIFKCFNTIMCMLLLKLFQHLVIQRTVGTSTDNSD